MVHNWQRYIPSWRLPLWQWGIILVFCAAVAVLLNTLFYWQYVASASASQSPSLNVAFWTYLPGESTRRIAWALVIPIALHFARLLPIQAGNGSAPSLGGVPKQLMVHGILSLAFAFMSALCTVVLVYILVPIFFPLRVLLSPMQEFVNHLMFVTGFTASVVLYWLILGGTNALAYYHAFRDQSLRASLLEAQLAQAQLHALQMQLNPHFLFNALNSVSSLLYEDVRRADTMLVRLGEFLRLTLNAPLAQCTSLRQELEFVRRYLDIEQMRFEERVCVEWDIAQEALNASVPTFILQPLVENALKHGILPSAVGGTVSISAARRGKFVQLSVSNRSAIQYSAIQHSALQTAVAPPSVKPDDTSTGIGLSNTRSRLEKLYQGAYTMDYGVLDGGGFAVVVTIPYQISDKK
ncbi:MAG: histidine kinase [Candidatus Kapabacteria bacterium]|nr:histidine kinase [Candidatus Kapabacteria bacterium]